MILRCSHSRYYVMSQLIDKTALVTGWFDVSELMTTQYRRRRMLESWEKARTRRFDGSP